MEMIPPWFAPTIEDMAFLSFKSEIYVNLLTPFERAAKMTRMRILGPNGPISISIPVLKQSKGVPASEIKIDYTQKWQNQHWRSLQTSYGRSPFFEYYQSELKHLFYQSPEYLTDFSVPILSWICKQYFPNILFSVILAENQNDFQPLGQFFMSDIQDKDLIRSNQRYTQVFGQDFVSGLTVWDTLFCAGPNFGILKTV